MDTTVKGHATKEKCLKNQFIEHGLYTFRILFFSLIGAGLLDNVIVVFIVLLHDAITRRRQTGPNPCWPGQDCVHRSVFYSRMDPMS